MEGLNLPATGFIYLDAAAFIYSVERIEPYRTLLDPVWRQAGSGRRLMTTDILPAITESAPAVPCPSRTPDL